MSGLISLVQPIGKDGPLFEEIERPVFICDHDADEHAARECGIDFIRYPDVGWPDIARRATRS